ncbi:MAG TPA: amino acid adenylation domain-containing protein, partial [Thermoanaerobaculia bacterium]|nr:amino acid adenylation domain-containing protein [Thermoanaerobaculia bacterium]
AAYRPFDLEREAPLRVDLFRRGAGPPILLLTIHHLATDFRSIAILTRDLAAAYATGTSRGAAKGRLLPAASKPVPSYGDFVLWQTSWLASPEGERAEAFWRERLAADRSEGALDLPADRPRPEARSFRAGSVLLRLDRARTGALEGFLHGRGATLFAGLLAAFQALLHRHSGQASIRVGAPALGRTAPATRDAVGYFVNPIVLEADVSSHPAFGAHLDDQAARVRAALDHQAYPFPLLVENLSGGREPGRAPLFQALLALHRGERPGEEPLAEIALGTGGARLPLGNLDLVSLPLAEGRSEFDLTLTAAATREGLALVLGYAADLFDRTTALRWAEDLDALLADLVHRPDAPVAALDRLDPARRQQVLTARNERAAMREGAGATGPAAGEAPRTPSERRVAAVWGDVLGRGSIDRNDDFFRIGGHSLLAVRVASQLRTRLGVDLPLPVLLRLPTVAALAAEIDRRREAAPDPAAGAIRLPILPRGERGAAPLSFEQRRLWFLDRLDEEGAAYNLAGVLAFAGPLDRGALAASLAELVRRHEALRTRFSSDRVADGGEPLQIAAPFLPDAGLGGSGDLRGLPAVDLSGLTGRSEAWGRAEAGRLAAAFARLRFDLERGPPVRFALLAHGAETTDLALAIHHIVADGGSIGVLAREIAALYGAVAAGRPSPLAEPALQAADVAVWQRREESAGVLADDLDFWRRELEEVPSLDLATDRPRPALPRFRGGRASVALAPTLAEALAALARSASATPFMLELAVWGALLARWSGQIDFALGTPVANRDRAELEPLVGCFVNTLALRLRLDPSAGFDAFLKRVRESSLAAYAHRELPFDLLVEALQPERGASRSPLFEAFFALDEPLPALRLPGLDVSLREIETGTAKFDLALALGMPDDRGTRGHFEYDSDLFDAATVERLARRWERLAAAVAAQPEAPLFEIDLLSDEERREIAAGQGPRLERTPVRLEARFFAQAARRPEAVALVTGATGEEMTYAELAARARRLAARLRALGVGPEVRVGLCTGRGPEMVAGMLGILAAGGAYVPLDPAYPPERLRYLLEDSGARLVVTAEGARERLPEGGFVAVAWDAPAAGAAEEIAASGRSERPAPPLLESLAYLIYTSGSTGRPKGVGIPHRSVSEFLDWVAEGFSAEELSGVLAATSMCFDLSVFELFGPLSHGGAVVLAENALALAGLAASARARLRLVNTVPSALGEVLRADLLPPSVVTVSLAGEPLPESLAARALATGGVRRVLNLYGPSEDTTYSTWGDAGAEVGTKVTIGRPLPNTRAAVFEPRAAAPTLAWPGATGELALGSASLARGYLGRPAETAESFRPDPSGTAPGARLYLTRDLVRRRPDGRLDFLGRRDHQVKVRGFRIELGEVEAALAAAPGVSEAAVAVERSAERPDRLVAYVAGGASLDAVRADLAARLPAHLVPSAWVGLAALPRTPNGKLDRKALPAPDAVVRPRRAPRTETERRLAALWAEVLGVAEIGAEDGFFDLGGHSLLAARVATRVKRDFGLDLSVRDLFARPTLAGLAARIEELRAEREESRGSPAANARRGARGERAEPETVAEWALAGIWCAVLDRARIDRDDDFFSAGGHSLLAAQVAARVRRAFGVDLSARELFARPTLRALAARIEELARAGAAEVEPAAPISPIASDAAAGEPRPISFAQERIWFLEQLEGPSALYNLPALVHLAGELDVPALGASFSWIAARHEAVRATFQVTADGPRQRISPPRPVPLPVADFSALGAGARQAVASAASRAARRPFDLARGPLLRTSLFRLAPGEAAVLFALHHVAADGWSLGILAEELAVAYPALAERRAPLLPEPPIQYSDYAAWQRESLSAERRAAEVAWWRDALAGLPPVLELPTDRPRPAERSPRGGTLPVRLPEGLLPAVDALARRSGATRFMVLLAAFQLLLGRLAGREETAVGTPVANRGLVEVEGLIGCFVNTLVLRADLQGAPSFSRLLERVRETAAGAFAHEAIPFEMLVDALAPDRSLDQSPLFQVLFALQPAPAPLVLPGLAATVSEVATGTAKFDFSLSLFDAGPRMTGFAEWSADLFDAPTVERLLARYQRLLAAAVASPETPIDAIPWLTEAEERQVREGGGEPAIGRLPPGSRERRGDPLPPGALRVHRPPRTPTERAVAAIWSEVLGVSGIGLDHGFFELGGHSLLAVRVAVRLREEFGVELVLRDQFAYPTLERLAARIEEELLARAGDENLDALLDQLEEAAGRPAGLVSLVRTDFTTRD